MFGIPFAVRVADIDETMDPTLPAAEAVAQISHKKALAVARDTQDVLIAADTIVVVAGKILGKPHTKEEAAEMLRLLSGRDHQVMTGVTVLCGDRESVFTEITDLHFRELTESEIQRYVESGEPMDKAGAYGIQGGAALFCQRMTGDYYNVMGLPVCHLGQVLKEMAPQIMGEFL